MCIVLHIFYRNTFKHKNIDEYNMSDDKKPCEEVVEEKLDYETVKAWLEKRAHQTITNKHNDFEMMNTILKNHPNYKDWKNQNCEAFKITRSPKNKALQVHIKMIKPDKAKETLPKISTLQTTKKRERNEWRIVSWVACAKGKVGQASSDKNQLTQAMRFAIRKQIKNWRSANSYNPKCALCEKTNHLEVDHYPRTFADMRDEFILKIANVVNMNDVKIRWDNSKISYRFEKGESVNLKWQRYHLKCATYRWLCSDCNKRMNKKSL